MKYLRGCKVNQFDIANDFHEAYQRCFTGDREGHIVAVPAFANGFLLVNYILKYWLTTQLKVMIYICCFRIFARKKKDYWKINTLVFLWTTCPLTNFCEKWIMVSSFGDIFTKTTINHLKKVPVSLFGKINFYIFATA